MRMRTLIPRVFISITVPPATPACSTSLLQQTAFRDRRQGCPFPYAPTADLPRLPQEASSFARARSRPSSAEDARSSMWPFRPPRRKHAQQLAHVSELRGLPCILRTQSSPSRCPSRVSEPRPCGSVLRRLCLRLCLCHLSSDSSHTDKFRPSTLRLARAIKIPSPRVIPVLKLVRIAGGPVCQNLLSRSWSWILDSGLILPVCSLRLRRSVRLFSVQFRSLTCTALPPGGASPPRPNPAQRAPSVLEDFSWRCSQ